MILRVSHIILLFLGCISLSGFAQKDSLANTIISKEKTEALKAEQKELSFQKFFFEALQQKSIGNFDKAIVALENCQDLKKDNKAVNFELGKNYFEQKKYIEAAAYTKKALEKSTENIHILSYLKNIYDSQSNFKEALNIQQKIVKLKPELQFELVILYIRNNQVESAKQLLIDLEKKGNLPDSLLSFKKSLFKEKGSDSIATNANSYLATDRTNGALARKYNADKSFNSLKQLLSQLSKRKQFIDLLKYSEEGVELFPAQPLVYLMKASALNQAKKYQEALSSLFLGLDYIVEDALLEAEFNDQIGLSYKGMKQNVKASKYYNKARELRQKKS